MQCVSVAFPGHTFFYIDLHIVKHEKNFLSETTRPRALIFDMSHPLVDNI